MRPSPALSLALTLALSSACRSAPDYAGAPGVAGPQLVSPAAETAAAPPAADDAVAQTGAAFQEAMPGVPMREETPAPSSAASIMDAALAEAAEPLAAAHSEHESRLPEALREEETPRVQNERRRELLEALGDFNPRPMEKLLASDEYDGRSLATEAVEAYAEGDNVRSVLLAQAALGADPGNPTRRKMLELIAARTGVAADPEGIVPKEALIRRELSKADEAFFSEDFGAAIQYCRRALLVDEKRPLAWQKLGSAQLASGDRARARESYLKALRLDPEDRVLRAFLARRGWLQ